MWWSRARLQPSGLNSPHRRSPSPPATAQVSLGGLGPPHLSVPELLPFSPLFCLNLFFPFAAVSSCLLSSSLSVSPVFAAFEPIGVNGIGRVFGCFCPFILLEVIENQSCSVYCAFDQLQIRLNCLSFSCLSQ